MRSLSIPLEWTQTMKSKLKNEKECGKDLVTKTILKVIIVIAFTAKSLGASAIPSALSPVHTSRTCRYCSYCDSAYSWKIRVKGEGAV